MPVAISHSSSTDGRIPKKILGEEPYEGGFPYEARTAQNCGNMPDLQAALRLFWDHLESKGWSDKMVLYISDERIFARAHRAQMRALCEMIHGSIR